MVTGMRICYPENMRAGLFLGCGLLLAVAAQGCKPCQSVCPAPAVEQDAAAHAGTVEGAAAASPHASREAARSRMLRSALEAQTTELERVTQELVDLSRKLYEAEESLRQEDPDLESLYNRMRESAAAYREALEARPVYQAVLNELEETKTARRDLAARVETLKGEIGHEE